MWARLETADNRIKRLKNQEALDFSNLMRRFETWVMTGEEGLQNAEEVLERKASISSLYSSQ